MNRPPERVAKHGHGFSLVEVVLALGIAAFGIISIVALFPLGLESTQSAREESAAQNIVSALVADRASSPFDKASSIYAIPALTPSMASTTGTLGVADTSQALTSLDQARYRVDYTLLPPATGMPAPYVAHFKVSWPAQNAKTSSCVEICATFPQP